MNILRCRQPIKMFSITQDAKMPFFMFVVSFRSQPATWDALYHPFHYFNFFIRVFGVSCSHITCSSLTCFLFHCLAFSFLYCTPYHLESIVRNYHVPWDLWENGGPMRGGYHGSQNLYERDHPKHYRLLGWVISLHVEESPKPKHLRFLRP